MLLSKRKSATRTYSAPALEKGLDILELLAGRTEGMTQSRIAAALGRSTSEIFRMLCVLEARGYLRRDPSADTYHLTTRLFAMSHQHPPTRTLLEAALPAMRRLAEQVRQSCHLAVLHELEVMTIAHIDSPEPRGITVRLGARFPILQTASGYLLLAMMEEPERAALLEALVPDPAGLPAVLRQIEAIRARGYERHRSRTIAGIVDLSYPVRDHAGRTVAALTVPYLCRRGERDDKADVQAAIAATAEEISRSVEA